MEKISDYRRAIDEIDAELIPLFERRMEVVRKVARYKQEHGLPVLQAGREEEVLRKAADYLHDKRYEPDVRHFMLALLEISRAAQQRDLKKYAVNPSPAPGAVTVGFFGVPGSFSEQALMDYYSEGQKRKAFAEFRHVFEALRENSIDYGVLPIENSSSGAITAVYDLLDSFGFSIVGERQLKISHHLAALSGATLETIQTVYSHEQGLLQTSEFLSAHPDWSLVPSRSTADSAQLVAKSGVLTKAAVCSARAASLYGLQIIAENIQNSRDNTTRFIVIGREMQAKGANKVSLVFTLDNASGTLFQTLRYFAERGINLVKIESRPIPEALWNYRFYLDFEGEIDNAQVKAALENLAHTARDFRVLGAYRADKN